MAEELPQDLPVDAGSAGLLEDDIVLRNREVIPDLLPAKPDAFNPYFDVVGNSLSGSDPVLRSGEDADPFKSIVEKAKAEPAPENPYYAMKPFTYSGDDDNNLFERYHSSGDTYDKLGFSPYRNNEALYNNNMTLGDEFVRAAKQWDDLVGVGFMSGIRSWETIFTDPLAPDMQGAKDMKHIMNVGSSGKGGVGGFFINTFLNSGYTVGVGLDFLGEELVLMGATAVTGGAGGGAMIGKGVSAISKLFARAEKGKTGAQGVHAAEELLQADRKADKLAGLRAMGNNFNDSRSFWTSIGRGAKSFATGTVDMLNPLDNTLAALKATDYATDYAKTVKTFGAFADDLLMIKGAVAEAKLEGGMVKIDANQAGIDEYRNDKIKNPEGNLPEGEELKFIEKVANDAAYRTALWNLPAIITSNKLMYATMLAPIRRIMGREVQELIPAIVFENKAFREVGEGIADRAKVAARSLRKPKIYGQFGMNYLKANTAEGVQENLQEAISHGAIEHAKALYKDPIRASYEGYMPHFMKGLHEQLSAQGAETFAGGFVMGMFAQPVMATVSTSISKVLNATVNKAQIDQLREERKKELHGWDENDENGNLIKHHMGTLDYLNDMVKDEKGNVNLDYFAPDLINAIRTGRLANDMFSAARLGDKNGTLNSRGALETNHLMTAIKTGKLDIILDRLKDYKNLSKAEAAEAFAKYGITGEEDVATALSHIDGVVERAKKVKESYEDGVNKYPNPINPRDFRKDPIKFRAAVIAKQAWDDAVYQLVFAKATFEDYSKRVADMTNTFAQISTALADENSQSVMALLGSQSTMNEINMLRREISVLDEKDAIQNTRKKGLTEKLEKIQKFYDQISAVKFAKSDEERTSAHEKAKEAFGDYIQHLGKGNGKLVFNDSIDAAYVMIKDHLLLKDDLAGLARSINVLMTPNSFLAVQEKMQRAYSSIFSKEMISDTLAMNADQFGFLKDIKAVIADITATTKQPSLLVPTELSGAAADAWRDGKAWPKVTHFIDAADGQTHVTEGESFDIALKKWNVFIALQKQPKAETEAQAFDRADISTYSAELLTLLRIPYDELSDEEKELKSFDEFVMEGERAPIINKYFDRLEEDNLDIPAEWKNLTLDEYKEVQAKLIEDAKTDPSLDPKLRLLEDIIAVKTMKESNMTPEKKLALGKLRHITDAAENIQKNDQGYWVNGAYTDLRITNLVYDIILPKHYDKEHIPFSQKEDSANIRILIAAAEKAFEEGNDAELDSVTIINKWVAAVKKNGLFSERFDDQKIADIKKEVGESTDVEDFKKALDKFAYKESTTAGNTVDELVRSFITYGSMKKPDSMSDEAFKSLRDSLHKFMGELVDRKETIVAKYLIVHGTAIVDGKEMSIGGEMDLVAINEKGELKIYDVKTGKVGIEEIKGVQRGKAGAWDFYGTDDDNHQKKNAYQLQLSLYAELLENLTGLKVDKDNMKIVPFEVDIDLAGDIKNIKLVDEAKNIELKYDPIVKQYIKPTKKGQTASAVVLPGTTAAALAGAKTGTADVRETLPATMDELHGKEVEWRGMVGTIKVLGTDNVVFETANVEYDVELGKEGIFENPKTLGFQGLMTTQVFAAPTGKTYDVEIQGENDVVVNGMSYYINTDANGNVESLSPVNRPDQKIRNEKMLIAVEIERNKLDQSTIAAVLKLKGPSAVMTHIEGIYADSMTEEIAEALDKLYDGAKMTKLEKELVELWAYDARVNLETFLNREGYQRNDELLGAIENLKHITNILYGEQYTKKRKAKEGDTEADVSGTTKKRKRRITKADSKKQAAEVKENEENLKGLWGVSGGKPKAPAEEKRKGYPVKNPELLKEGDVVIDPNGHEYTVVRYDEGYEPEFSPDDNVTFPGQDAYLEVINAKGEKVYISEEAMYDLHQKVGKNLATPVLTMAMINANLSLDYLKQAKAKHYEVLFDKVNYKIFKVGKNSVTLRAPNVPDVIINVKDLSKLKVVRAGVEATTEDNNTIKSNEVILSGKGKVYNDVPVNDSFNDVINNFSKC